MNILVQIVANRRPEILAWIAVFCVGRIEAHCQAKRLFPPATFEKLNRPVSGNLGKVDMLAAHNLKIRIAVEVAIEIEQFRDMVIHIHIEFAHKAGVVP